MFKWKKSGLVFKPQEIKGRTWLNEFAQAPAVLVFDKFVRVYFACRPLPDEKGMYVSYTGYVDLNRSNLHEVLNVSEKPIFELGELGTFDEHGTYPVSVIRREKDILAYYAGWSRCESVPFNIAIGAAISNDEGKSFTKLGKGPILSYSPEEAFIVEIVNKIRYATSDDGLNWTRNYVDIIENRVEENECQASPDVFYYKNKYHMFFCYRHSLDFRSREKGYRIGYAVSDDLVNWTRDDSKVGIDVSDEGWDSEMISYPHVFELDGKVYMFYLGNQVGRQGFGLAELESYTS